MAGVHVVSSLGVFVFLLFTSLSAAREERAARAAWGPLEGNDLKTYNYLALVKCDAGICSGSIISETMVITYCAQAQTGCAVYAGSSSISTARTKNKAANTQVLQVQSVKEYSKDLPLKICVMNDTWKFGDFVGDVTLHLNGNSGLPKEKCTVLGFKQDVSVTTTFTAHKMVEQEIGGSDKCAVKSRGAAEHLYSEAAVDGQLGATDLGGPAVCGKEQWGISEKFEPAQASQTVACNLYMNIAAYSKWIASHTTDTSDDGTTNGNGTTNTTGTSNSRGYSLHHHSEYKVLWFLAVTIVIFLLN